MAKKPNKNSKNDTCSIDEEMLMWTSYRYCIGRQTYVSSLAGYMAKKYYPILSDERKLFTAKDIRSSILDRIRWTPFDFSYEGTVNYEGINTAATELLFDNRKYFAYKMADIDAAQLVGDVMMPIARDMAYDLKRVVDAAVLAEAVSAAQTKVESVSIANVEDTYNKIIDIVLSKDEFVMKIGDEEIKLQFVEVIDNRNK